MEFPHEQLLAMAGSAPTPVARHHAAQFAVEALLKEAVALRLAQWMASGKPADPKLATHLGRLPRASMGEWLQLLRTLDDGTLKRARVPESWATLAAQAAEHGVLDRQLSREAKRVLGAFGVAVAWRNAVMGHGALRSDVFYGEFGPLLLEAASALSAMPELLDGAMLVEGGQVEHGGVTLSLSPVVVDRPHPHMERRQTAFLNSVRVKWPEGTVGRATYLDYVSSEQFEGDTEPVEALLKHATPPRAGVVVETGWRRYRGRIAAGATALTLAGLIGAYGWDQSRTKVSWATAIEIVDGALVGKGFVSAGQPSTHFKVETVGGQVNRVSWARLYAEPNHRTSVRNLPDLTDLEQVWSGDELVEIRGRDSFGGVLWRAVVDRPEPDVARWRYRTETGMPMRGPSSTREPGRWRSPNDHRGVFGVNWTLDGDGRPIHTAHLNREGAPMQDGDEVWGNAIERDDRGRIVAITHLDGHGNPSPAATLETRTLYAYDDAHPWLVKSMDFIGGDGEPVRQVNGGERFEQTWDSLGRLVSFRPVGADGSAAAYRFRRILLAGARGVAILPFAHAEGCEQIALEWSDAGNLVAQYCRNAAGEPILSGSGVAAQRYTYGEGGCVTSIRTELLDGEPLPPPRKAGTEIVCSEQGLPAKVRLVDGAGKAVLWNGAIDVLYEWDARGRMIRQYNTDENGKQVPLDHAVVERTFTWSDNNILIGQKQMGFAGAPVLDFNTKSHRMETQLDELGRPSKVVHYGLDDQPLHRPAPLYHPDPHPGECRQHAQTAKDYDASGRLTAIRKLDAEGRPYTDYQGFASRQMTYEDGRVVHRFFDTRGQPGHGLLGCSVVHQDLNDLGLVVALSCFDGDDAPMNSKYGPHRVVTERDSAGREIAVAFFDTQGKPTHYTGPYHRRITEYDDRGRVTYVAHFDEEGQPSIGDTPAHADRFTYGDQHPTLREVIGLDGRPMVQWHLAFNGVGKLVRVQITDGDGKPASAFGILANILEYHHNPATGELDRVEVTVTADERTEGDAYQILFERDQTGEIVRETITDLEGTRRLGQSAAFYGFPEPARSQAEREVGEGNIPVISHPASQQVTYTMGQPLHYQVFSRRDVVKTPSRQIASAALFGPDDEPMTDSRGMHRMVFEYTPEGNPTTYLSYGVVGEPVPGLSGAFRQEMEWEDGRIIRVATRDGLGDLVAKPGGHAVMTFAFDALGNNVEQIRLGEDGERLKTGWSRRTRHFDGRMEIRRELYDADDRHLGTVEIERYEGGGAKITWPVGHEATFDGHRWSWFDIRGPRDIVAKPVDGEAVDARRGGWRRYLKSYFPGDRIPSHLLR